ncbi:MAG: bis(5'-nucleosyl)-tetraphosphatase (symmetrical) YqeK [Firmicutes bacterium]|nr:bis(5'-nucleosyl)-tetraphosphatase (symmetrical) YqeK [Bacillota bacterium]
MIPDLDELRQRMNNTLSARRYAHCEAVAAYSVELARRWGVDEELAYAAGLLHDLMHCLAPEEYLSWALVYGVPCDRAALEDPQLLHGPLAAAVLEQDYYCDDPRLLEAVRCHTVPEPDMGDLAKIVYVADMLEPTRKPWPGVDELRRLAATDLDGCVAACLEHTLLYLRERGKAPHPNTEALLRHYRAKARAANDPPLSGGPC